MLFDRKKLIADFYETLSPADKKTWLTHRKGCDKSMFFFCKEVGGSVQKSGGDINKNLHGVIMDSWQDPKVTRQGATMPRGWRKTTTLTILGNIWEYLQNPEIRILLPSEKQDTASKWIMQMGNHLLRNERLRWLYPELSPVNEDWARNHRWSSLYLELPRNGFYPEPTIECVGIRGAAQGGHYDLICLLPGSKVYTSNGLINIEDIKPGNRVLSRDGRYHLVLRNIVSHSEKPCREISVSGSGDKIRCTEDHKILVYRDGTIDWIRAKDVLAGDYTCLPVCEGKTRCFSRVNKGVNNLLENNDFWRFLGYWLAEGCATDKYNSVRMTFGISEMRYAEDVREIISSLTGATVGIRETKSSTLMTYFCNRDVKEILGKFGSHAHNKHIPPMILSSHEVKKVELIRGYFRGDGCKLKIGNGWSAISVSQSLVIGIQQLLASLGISSTVRLARPGRVGVLVSGNVCNTRDTYVITVSSPMMDIIMGSEAKWTAQTQRLPIIPGYMLFPVKENNPLDYSGNVYDLSVRDQNNFVVSGGCVHNSPDDLVGEKGMESALVLEDALRWFDNIEELLIQPSMDAWDASRIRVLGTHWGPGDHIEYMVEKYPEYKWYMVSCLKHDIESSRENVVYLHNPDVGTGESNFPEGGTTDHYIAMKANPDKEMVFWAQHMNMPTGASKTTKFDYNWLRFYTIQERDEGGKIVRFVVCDDGQEFRLDNITKYGLIDPGGFSETKLIKGGSRNVLFVAGQPDNSVKKFIFDVSAKRFKEPKAFMDIFFEMNDKWNVRLWKIETIAAQKYIYKDIIEEKRRRGSRVTVIPMDPDVNKAAKEGRITGLIAPCSAGEYFIHRSMKDLIGEYRSYPSGLTKDIVDMWGVYNRDFAKRRAPSDTKGAPIKPRPALLEDGPDGRSEVTGY